MVVIENTGRTKLKLRYRVSLLPGLNEVDVDAWSLCRRDPITQHYLGVGRVRVHGVPSIEVQPELPFDKKESAPEPAVVEKQKQEPIPASEPIASRGNGNGERPSVPTGMSAVDARAFVKACRRPDVLERMLSLETRGSVVTAIEKRLQQLA